jgi:hypothetical protein
MQLATCYVPWSLAEGTQMTTEDTAPGGLYSRLADLRRLRPTNEHTGPNGRPAEADRDAAVAMTPWQHARTPWTGRAATA